MIKMGNELKDRQGLTKKQLETIEKLESLNKTLEDFITRKGRKKENISNKKESLGAIIGKSFLQGMMPVLDAPANLARGTERGAKMLIEYLDGEVPPNARKEINEKMKFSKMKWKRATTPYKDPGPEHDYFREENVDRPSKWIKDGAKKLGIEDLTPNPSNPLERIVSSAADLGGTFFTAPFLCGMSRGKPFLNSLTDGVKAGTYGGVSGALSGEFEEEGHDPALAKAHGLILSFIGKKGGEKAWKKIKKSKFFTNE